MSSATSPLGLQEHLYASFLDGRTSDISLRVHGLGISLAIYKLHRVVLTQAGFFRSLFTAGFEETFKHHNDQAAEIDITFDDRNITRAAFEVCIARLYGGGPPLYVSSSLRPTPLQPLTSAFTDPLDEPAPPSGYHLATPRFLLSLLATSVYLSIPSIASQALSLILSSIGPTTVVEYLDFALGKAIADPEPDEPESAVGLEGIATVSPLDDGNAHEVSKLARDPHDDHQERDRETAKEDYVQSSGPPNSTSHFPDSNHVHKEGGSTLIHDYGTVSSKIGEAAACWLARWGPDMLTCEERAHGQDDRAVGSVGGSSIPPSSRTIPKIWSRGGLDAKWISGLISSDVLFVRGEKERYDFAERVVELRRMDGVHEEEEEVWTDMFSNGIYYTNMLTEDLINISQDVSPKTKRPYVPLNVLQSANWNQSLLRYHITAKPSLSPRPSSPAPTRKELGLSVTTANILGASSEKANGHNANLSHLEAQGILYYPVPHDNSFRLGDNGGVGDRSDMDLLFDVPSRSNVIPSEDNFFGIKAEKHDALSCVAQDPTGKSRWTPYPPFRFAAEFWDIGSLKEKIRLHSRTIWYAGSLFNVYVQVVRKKGLQLGVYLHRQSSIEPIPPSSFPPPSPSPSSSCGPNTTEKDRSTATSGSSLTHSIACSPPLVPLSRSATPLSTRSTPTSATSAPLLPALSPPVAPLQPFRDPRPSMSAYFTISCASATGSSLTQFTSAPDIFNISQSWGWKSSSLNIEDFAIEESTNENSRKRRPEVSLRVTITLGIV